MSQFKVPVRPPEVKKGVKHVRSLLTDAVHAIDSGDLHATYAALEQAQLACFDTKTLLVHGGRYEREAS